jgi:acyl carrier protein
LINTVPVRASITADTSNADLLDQLQSAHNHTLEHQHLGLSEIHRVSGQERLFDTVFVYENYPTDAAALPRFDGLAVTELTNRDHYHYPLTIQAVPGRELDLRVQYRVDVFDATDIDALIERLQRVLMAMTADPTQPLSSMALLDGGEHARLDGWGNGAVPAQPATTPVSAPEYHDNGGGYHAPATLVEQILADIYAQVLGVDRVGVDESFFDLGGDSLAAMRAIAAINTALDTHLAVPTLFDAPTVGSLSQRLGGHASSVEEVPAVSPAGDL